MQKEFIKALNSANKKLIDEMNLIYKKDNINLEKYTDYSTAFFIREGYLYCTSEDGHDVCDYYGEFRGGYPWINPILEKIADKNGYYWEWKNPGCIFLQD